LVSILVLKLFILVLVSSIGPGLVVKHQFSVFVLTLRLFFPGYNGFQYSVLFSVDAHNFSVSIVFD